MELALILAIPFAAALAAALPLSLAKARWLVHLSSSAIVVQSCFVLATWLLVATLPQGGSDRQGGTCPQLDEGHGDAVWVVAFSAIGVGAIALAASVLSVRRGAASSWRGLSGVGACLLTYVVWVSVLSAAWCGMS